MGRSLTPTLAPAPERGRDDIDFHCVARDLKGSGAAEFAAICNDDPITVIRFRNCPPECGGHPICWPCLALARERGFDAPVGS